MQLPHDIATRKRSLRHTALAGRDQHTLTDLQASDRAIFHQLTAHPKLVLSESVFVFISVQQEIDTRRLIQHLHRQGRAVLVPRLHASEMFAVPFGDWSTLCMGPLGIPMPPALEPYAGTIDTVIVPGLRFSLDGHRLGYGGGFYDRWLTAHPTVFRIGVCREDELLSAVPRAQHDQAVDQIVTERRVIHITRQFRT